MTRIVSTLTLTALTLAGGALGAEDFGPLMAVAHATWTDKNHIGVICDYSRSRNEIDDLAVAAGAGSRITVLDTRSRVLVDRALALAVQRQPDYLVLLNGDDLAPCGSPAATAVVFGASRSGIPCVATRAAGIRQGAVFAVGAETGGEVLVNSHLIGTVQVILPQRGTFIKNALFPPVTGKAEVMVASR